MTATRVKESLQFSRLMMVLSSFWPLFTFWMIRGMPVVPTKWLILSGLFLIIFPNLFLLRRERIARKNKEFIEVTIEQAEDHRDHLLTYLFAMLTAFFGLDVTTVRGLIAVGAALVFLVFLFLRMRMHFMNPIYAFRDFNVFTLPGPIVLLSPRDHLTPGLKIKALRISDTVYLEES